MEPQKQNSISDLRNLDSYFFENVFNVYKNKDNYYYNLLRTVNFPQTIDSAYCYNYVVPYDNITWTNISFIHYQATNLWWLICSINNIQNPVEFPKAGTILKILKPEYVSGVIQAIKTN